MKNLFVHPSAEVKTDSIGDGTQIWQHCVILEGAKIGKNCNVNCHCFIEGDVLLGDRVTVKCGVYLWDGLRTEDDVFIGPNVTFTNDRFPRSRQYPDTFDRTVICKGASIGAAAVILGGVTIGEYALVGANALVTKDVPPFALVAGSPARVIGKVCKCGQKIEVGKTCTFCANV